jgi:hypothetical protein
MLMTIDKELDDLMYSSEYAEYIMEHSGGDRIICNGDTLTAAMEDGYLFNEFLDSVGVDGCI